MRINLASPAAVVARLCVTLIALAGMTSTIASSEGSVGGLIPLAEDQENLVFPDGSGAFPTIQAAIDGLDPESIILLAPGEFTGDGNRELVLGRPIVLRAYQPDRKTVLRPEGALFVSTDSSPLEHGLVLDGLIIQDGRISYVGADINFINVETIGFSLGRLESCTVTYQSCKVTGQGNMNVWDGANLRVFDSRFSSCGRIYGGYETRITLRRSMFDNCSAFEDGSDVVSIEATDCTFRNMATALAIQNSSGAATGCVFENCGTAIAMLADSYRSVSLVDCVLENVENVFWGNSNYQTVTGCVFRNVDRISRSNEVVLVVEDTLIEGGDGKILDIDAGGWESATLRNCTIVGRTGDLLADWGEGVSIFLDHTIIADHQGRIAPCDVEYATDCSCLFDIADPACLPTSGFIERDPQFCDPAAGDYTLAETSPCADASSICGRIGALDPGCPGDPASVEPDQPTTPLSAVWPNPAQDGVALSRHARFGDVVRLLDVRGREVASWSLRGKGPSVWLPFSRDLKAGVYFLDFREHGADLQRVVVVR